MSTFNQEVFMRLGCSLSMIGVSFIMISLISYYKVSLAGKVSGYGLVVFCLWTAWYMLTREKSVFLP